LSEPFPSAPFSLGIDRMDLAALEAIARGRPVALGREAAARMEASRRAVERALAGDGAVYGVSTGFGHLANTRIAPDQLAQLQLNLVRSHAAGVGQPLDPPAVRALVALRAHALALGHSGVRPSLVEALAALLAADVLPVVPREGSVGASGDLAPLAHLALVLVGEGEAWYAGRRMPAAEALGRAGLTPVALTAKEGLALTNGSQLTAGVGALAVCQADRLLAAADLAAALTLQALRGIAAAYDEALLALRPHPGAVRAGRRLRALLAGSALVTRPGEVRVQDAYSLRAVPQVHGSARDALAFARGVLEVEMNAATDNPLLVRADDPEGVAILSGANFHGAPLALALDVVPIALGQVAAMSERRTERLVNPALSGGLPPFLTASPGLHSGLMVAQYTAAALVSAMRTLAHPASVDTIPTSAGQEDVVSMGPIAARKAADAVDRLAYVLAIECLTAAQALDFVGSDRLSPPTGAAHALLRRHVPHLDGDRPLGPDIERVRALVAEGALVAAAQGECAEPLTEAAPAAAPPPRAAL
jgi:histidine ammonia-lyase